MTRNVSSSDFLALPGELKNRIFEYVLTADKPLLYAGAPQGLRSIVLVEHAARHPFNRIKQVCQELACDTADLELKYNEILIVATPAIAACQKFEEMQSRLGPSRIKWLRRVAIKPSRLDHLLPVGYSPYRNRVGRFIEGSDLDTLANVSWFCRKNPNVVLRFLAPHFEYHVNNPTLEGILFYCFAISKLLRDLQYLAIMPQAWAPLYAAHWAEASTAAARFPTNLIYCPFDEDFQADVANFINKLWKTTALRKPDAARVMRQVHDWIMNGI